MGVWERHAPVKEGGRGLGRREESEEGGWGREEEGRWGWKVRGRVIRRGGVVRWSFGLRLGVGGLNRD